MLSIVVRRHDDSKRATLHFTKKKKRKSLRPNERLYIQIEAGEISLCVEDRPTCMHARAGDSHTGRVVAPALCSIPSMRC
jgi:hypothetical protein